MIPVLHHNHTGSIHIQYLNWGQKGDLLFAVLSVDDWLQPDRWGYDNIRSIKIGEVYHLFLFGENLDTHSKEIVFIVLVLLYFLLVLDLPFERCAVFFILLSFNWHLLNYWLCNFLILHKLLFNEIEDGFGITNVWSENEILRIGESFCLFTLFQSLDTVNLMFIHVSDYYLPEFLYSLLLIVLNMNEVDVIVDDVMSDLVLFWRIFNMRTLLLLHLCRWFWKFRVLKCKLGGCKNISLY